MTGGALLNDEEIAAWLLSLRQEAQSASLAAAIATGDQNTKDMLAEGADVARRRAEWLQSRALPPAACTWCDAVGEPCQNCTPEKGECS